MPIANPGIRGRPAMPYVDEQVYAGTDVFFDITCLDHTMTEVVPTAFTYQLDDIWNAKNMIPSTSIASQDLAEQMTIQLPGASMVMTYEWQGSQICQLSYTMTAVDSVTGASFSVSGVRIVELVAIQTPC